jgi:hypothetical protein
MAKPEHFPRIDRRVALKWISSAAISVPFLGEDGADAVDATAGADAGAGAPAGVGYGRDPDLQKIYQAGDLWPLTFSPKQRRLVILLCDIIVPADEHSPAASALGVHDFIDEWISSPYADQAADRKLILKGLEWLDAEAGRRGAATFAELDAKVQIDVCTGLSIAASEDRRKYPGSFFLRMRDLVAGGYYTTPAGMKELGYRGNVAMSQWNGPPPEVLERLGLSPQ